MGFPFTRPRSKSERRGKHRALPADSSCLSQKTLKSSGHFRVHVLYKRAEIPANAEIPEFDVSVTYRKHETAENTGSTPVSATNSINISQLQNSCTGLALHAAPKSPAKEIG